MKNNIEIPINLQGIILSPSRLSTNSWHSIEKCYFRHQVKINKADKLASLLHATCRNKTVAKNSSPEK